MAEKEVKEKTTTTAKTAAPKTTTKKAEPKAETKTVKKTVKAEEKPAKKVAEKEAKPAVKKAETKTTAKATEKAETKTVKKTVKTEEKAETKKVEKAEPKTAAKKPAAKAEEKPAAKKTAKPKKTAGKAQEFLGTGKRKTSVARVRLTTGTGKIVVNGEDLKKYFELDTLITIVKQPLVLTETENTVDIVANIYGGGKSGQAGALRHGITRALIDYKAELRPELKKAGFVTRDARKKERKKYGLHKARRAPQFSKR